MGFYSRLKHNVMFFCVFFFVVVVVFFFVFFLFCFLLLGYCFISVDVTVFSS